MLPELTAREKFAAEHSHCWQGCIECKESHFKDSRCQCGQCFYALIGRKDSKGRKLVVNDEMGTFVYCPCGKSHLWD